MLTSTTFPQRFRYRGTRESWKWNIFLMSVELDSSSLKANIQLVVDDIKNEDPWEAYADIEGNIAAKLRIRSMIMAFQPG